MTRRDAPVSSEDDDDPRTRPVLRVQLMVALGSSLAGTGLLIGLGITPCWTGIAALTVTATGCAVIAIHLRRSRLGWANGITLARLVGLSWIAALTSGWLAQPPSTAGTAVLVAIAVLCLVLDGVDGAVARARDEVSEFGARFDMETDAATIMVLCAAVLLSGSVSWWVLIIGLARYGYWLCSLRVPALTLPVAPRLWRKAVAVGQSAALLICLTLGASGLGPGWLPSLIAATALAALAWSFATVIAWQLRAAPHKPAAR
jgi:phosphatidylglycerophosphate synthase